MSASQKSEYVREQDSLFASTVEQWIVPTGLALRVIERLGVQWEHSKCNVVVVEVASCNEGHQIAIHDFGWSSTTVYGMLDDNQVGFVLRTIATNGARVGAVFNHLKEYVI